MPDLSYRLAYGSPEIQRVTGAKFELITGAMVTGKLDGRWIGGKRVALRAGLQEWLAGGGLQSPFHDNPKESFKVIRSAEPPPGLRLAVSLAEAARLISCSLAQLGRMDNPPPMKALASRKLIRLADLQEWLNDLPPYYPRSVWERPTFKR